MTLFPLLFSSGLPSTMSCLHHPAECDCCVVFFVFGVLIEDQNPMGFATPSPPPPLVEPSRATRTSPPLAGLRFHLKRLGCRRPFESQAQKSPFPARGNCQTKRFPPVVPGPPPPSRTKNISFSLATTLKLCLPLRRS